MDEFLTAPVSFWSLRTKRYDLSKTPVWMGIINLTPDSFSDGGQFAVDIDNNSEKKRFVIDNSAVIEYALNMIEQGAGILDLGGESSRPGSEPISENEEIQRVIPVVQRLSNKTLIPISVDTTRASVAELAILAGAEIINDISGGTFDPDMIDVIRRYQPGYCLTHIQGTPQTMQNSPTYQDVVQDVFDWLKKRRDCFLEAGIPQEKICIDVGIGFGKTFEQNIELLKNIDRFFSLGCPLLVGHSRKRFLNYFLFQKDAYQYHSLFELKNKTFEQNTVHSTAIPKTDSILSASMIAPQIILNNEPEPFVNPQLINAVRDDWTAIISLILAQKGVQILRVHHILKNRTAVALNRMLRNQELL